MNTEQHWQPWQPLRRASDALLLNEQPLLLVELVAAELLVGLCLWPDRGSTVIVYAASEVPARKGGGTGTEVPARKGGKGGGP